MECTCVFPTRVRYLNRRCWRLVKHDDSRRKNARAFQNAAYNSIFVLLCYSQ